MRSHVSISCFSLLNVFRDVRRPFKHDLSACWDPCPILLALSACVSQPCSRLQMGIPVCTWEPNVVYVVRNPSWEMNSQ